MVPCEFSVWSERSSRRGGVESRHFSFQHAGAPGCRGATADHRRGLVVEVAPNVVDATAVDLSDVDGDRQLARQCLCSTPWIEGEM